MIALLVATRTRNPSRSTTRDKLRVRGPFAWLDSGVHVADLGYLAAVGQFGCKIRCLDRNPAPDYRSGVDRSSRRRILSAYRRLHSTDKVAVETGISKSACYRVVAMADIVLPSGGRLITKPEDERRIAEVYARTKSIYKTITETGFTFDVIRRVAHAYGIARPRGFTSAVSVPTYEDKLRIVAAYRETRSANKASRETGFKRGTIESVAKEAGAFRETGDFSVGPPVNEAAFDEPLSEEGAYWMGFIAADGCVIPAKNAHKVAYISLGLAWSDRPHVEKFVGFFSPGRTIYRTCRKTRGLWHEGARVDIPSNRRAGRLGDYGIVSRKTYGMPNLRIPAQNEAAFWRGWVDGDGCVYWSSKRFNALVNLVAVRNACEAFRVWTERVSGRPAPKVMPRNDGIDLCCVAFNGTHRALEILRPLYRDATIYLDRKNAKWQLIEKELTGRLIAQPPRRRG